VTAGVILKAYGINPSAVPKSAKGKQGIFQMGGQYVSPSDLSQYCKTYSPNADCSIAKFVGQNCPAQSGTESMLDVEMITGVAKGIDTWVYSYPGGTMGDNLLSWASDMAETPGHPQVVSVSYGQQYPGNGLDSQTISRFSEEMKKLGTMGVTVVIASGDSGSGGQSRAGPNGGKLYPSWPASDPYVLAAGATTFVSGGLSGEQSATTAFGSGGGFSWNYQMPSYQASVVQAYLAQSPQIGSDSYAQNGRGTPDVSSLGQNVVVVGGGDGSGGGSCTGGGDGDGGQGDGGNYGDGDGSSYGDGDGGDSAQAQVVGGTSLSKSLTGYYGDGDGDGGDGAQTQVLGGTSCAAPAWGAIISLLNQECLTASGGSKTLGFVNPLFYQNADAFTDITVGSNAVGINQGNGWKVTKGWDAATGLGTANFPKLQEVVRKACSGAGPAPGPAPPAPGPAPSGGNYECSWWSGKCETSMFGWYTSKSKCENETSCKPSPMDSIVV